MAHIQKSTSIVFPRPRMDEEKRIALLPRDIEKDIENPHLLFFQKGYGRDYDVSDRAYRQTGARVVREDDSCSMDVFCQPKFYKEDLSYIKHGQVIFGWMHKDAEKNGSK